MQSKSDIAAGYLDEGFSCSTSILLTFRNDDELDAETAARISCGFGGGCSSGELCGAAVGGVMVIGLKHGQESGSDTGAKANCRAHVIKFIGDFKEKNGALTCRDLLDCDPTTEEGHAIYLAKRATVCYGAVRNAADILADAGY